MAPVEPSEGNVHIAAENVVEAPSRSTQKIAIATLVLAMSMALAWNARPQAEQRLTVKALTEGFKNVLKKADASIHSRSLLQPREPPVGMPIEKAVADVEGENPQDCDNECKLADKSSRFEKCLLEKCRPCRMCQAHKMVSHTKRNDLEWEVVAKHGAHIHSSKDDTSAIRSTKVIGAIVFGERQPDNWLALLGQVGYMKIESSRAEPFLKAREASYAEISHGNCNGLGLHPVNEALSCAVVAAALGEPDIIVHMQTIVESAPEGCYFKDGKKLWLSITNKTHGNGADKYRHQLCSSQLYPVVVATLT